MRTGNSGTLAFVADALAVADRDGIKVQRGCRRGVQSHLVLRTAEGQSMRMTRHLETAHTLARVVASPREGGVEVRVRAVSDPRLRAVEFRAMISALRASRHARDVGSGLRFGQRVRAQHLSADYLRQVGRRLLRRSECRHRVRRHHVHRHADADAEQNTLTAAQRVRELIDDSTRAGAFRRVPAAFVGEVVTATMRRITSGEIAAATGLSDAEAYSELAKLVVAAIRR
jgi:hypothetical protein